MALKVDDKVAVYQVYTGREIGEIVAIYHMAPHSDEVLVRMQSGFYKRVHIKQCRKLVNKKRMTNAVPANQDKIKQIENRLVWIVDATQGCLDATSNRITGVEMRLSDRLATIEKKLAA